MRIRKTILVIGVCIAVFACGGRVAPMPVGSPPLMWERGPACSRVAVSSVGRDSLAQRFAIAFRHLGLTEVKAERGERQTLVTTNAGALSWRYPAAPPNVVFTAQARLTDDSVNSLFAFSVRTADADGNVLTSQDSASVARFVLPMCIFIGESVE